ncbi:hypothetical protein CEXT_153971 [Caerostris extrusa]|uniref:Uncharacterized protein n=1 Tax=Caerostris extrusa TaxID=172846 RepID=A0AAV4WQC3_CAEEX|nr:hypothetical protein CEXT_153971 [Caerostris extrusa]
MAVKYTNNKFVVGELHGNENLEVPVNRDKKINFEIEENFNILKMNTFKSQSNKIGLIELSNDKAYLESEIPSRKRFKSEFYNNIQNQRLTETIIKKVESDTELINSINDKYSSEKSKIDSQVLTCNAQLQENILANQIKQDSVEEINSNDGNIEAHDLKLNFEDSLPKVNSNTISTVNSKSCENDIDLEAQKCYELLNADSYKISDHLEIGKEVTNNDVKLKIDDDTKRNSL